MSVFRALRSTRPCRMQPSQVPGCRPTVCATNFTEQPARVTVRYSLQGYPALFSQPLLIHMMRRWLCLMWGR